MRTSREACVRVWVRVRIRVRARVRVRVRVRVRATARARVKSRVRVRVRVAVRLGGSRLVVEGRPTPVAAVPWGRCRHIRHGRGWRGLPHPLCRRRRRHEAHLRLWAHFAGLEAVGVVRAGVITVVLVRNHRHVVLVELRLGYVAPGWGWD